MQSQSGDQDGRQKQGSTFILRDLQLWQKTSGNARALHGLPTQREAFPQLHQATVIKHKTLENFDSRNKTSQEHWRLSAWHKHRLSPEGPLCALQRFDRQFQEPRSCFFFGPPCISLQTLGKHMHFWFPFGGRTAGVAFPAAT